MLFEELYGEFQNRFACRRLRPGNSATGPAVGFPLLLRSYPNYLKIRIKHAFPENFKKVSELAPTYGFQTYLNV
jgi:hypothetical protein